MSAPNTQRYIVATIAIVVGAYLAIVLIGKTAPKPAQHTEVQQREISVVSVLRINESETVKALTVPDAMLSDPLFDTRCLIYTNQELRQTQIKCLARPGE